MTAETALATVSDTGAALAEQVVLKGDLSRLTEQQRMSYYSEVCRSLGLNPLTRPFEYITLNGKLTLYATRGAADQLRSIRGITITNLEPKQLGDLLVVVATGRDASGREDSSTGAVSVAGLKGEALANAMMKAETKAKRRLTLSLAGLGWSDETEIASIPSAQAADVDPATGEIRRPPSLADRVQQRRASIERPSAEVVETDKLPFDPAAGPAMILTEEELADPKWVEMNEPPVDPGQADSLPSAPASPAEASDDTALSGVLKAELRGKVAAYEAQGDEWATKRTIDQGDAIRSLNLPDLPTTAAALGWRLPITRAQAQAILDCSAEPGFRARWEALVRKVGQAA